MDRGAPAQVRSAARGRRSKSRRIRAPILRPPASPQARPSPARERRQRIDHGSDEHSPLMPRRDRGGSRASPAKQQCLVRRRPGRHRVLRAPRPRQVARAVQRGGQRGVRSNRRFDAVRLAPGIETGRVELHATTRVDFNCISVCHSSTSAKRFASRDCRNASGPSATAAARRETRPSRTLGTPKRRSACRPAQDVERRHHSLHRR